MQISDIPFAVTDWASVPGEHHRGVTGVSTWRTQQYGAIRVRVVEYSAGYLADHWCGKGHILFVLDGELKTELRDGRTFTLSAGMSYQVADNDGEHRSSSVHGARLFIVD